MSVEITRLESSIDVLFLIHKAMRSKAKHVEDLVNRLEVGESLQSFRIAFNSWATFAAFHSEQEDTYITGPLIKSEAPANGQEGSSSLWRKLIDVAALEEQLHRDLLAKAEEILGTIYEEIGRMRLIFRTKQHLYAQVVNLRLTQEDYLETEETLVLPLVREKMGREKQLSVVNHLLIDDQAVDPYWSLNWVKEELTPTERGLVDDLVSSFGVPSGQS